MNQEIKQTLQRVIDSIDKPAYIEKNNKIILANDLFLSKKINQKDFKKNGLELKKIDLSGDIKLCEVIESEIYKLNQSSQRLVKAMTLL
jgi:hypothetical protein